MKTHGLSVIAAAILLSGCSKPAAETGMPADQLEPLRQQARQAMLEAATNAVPGIHAVISADAFTESKSVPKWTGLVTLDYVNHAGGIDRTNLHVVYGVAGEKLFCLEDSEYYHQQWLAHIHRIESGQER